MRLRLVGPGGDGTVAIVARPFAVIGRSPRSDLPVPSPAAEERHAYLHLDRGGVFAVDLATRTGTRFDGAPDHARSCWLRPGLGLELAGYRVELLDAQGLGPDPDEPGDPLAKADGLALLELRPEGGDGRPSRLLSALSFLGRSRSCAVKAEGDGVARVHAVLVRTAGGAFVVDLVGDRLSVNGRPPAPAAPLRDGDLMELGRSRFEARVRPALVAPAAAPPAGLGLAATPTPAPRDAAAGPPPRLPPDAPEELLRPGDPFQRALVAIVRQLYQEHEALFERHMERLDRLQGEVAELREEIRRRLDAPPPAAPTALDPPPIRAPRPSPPADAARATSWLIDRLGTLEAEVDREARSGWRDLLVRLGTPPRPPGDS